MISLQRAEEGQSFEDKVMAVGLTLDKMDHVGQILFPLEFLIGDGVVLWRTWALWQDRPRMIAFPVAIWSASLVSFIGGQICEATKPGINVQEPGCSRDFLIANWALSIGANAVATFMITYRAWQHRQAIKASFGPSAKTTQVERVLALLIESGFIYLLLWAVQATAFSNFEDGAGLILSRSVTSMGNQFVGLYPTVIIVLVDLQRTFWDSHSKNSNVRDISTLHFAAGGAPDSEDVGTMGRDLVHIAS